MRPIRFGSSSGVYARDAETLLAKARASEEAGYATFAFGDHFSLPLAPLVALQAVAAATSKLRLTTTVLDQDFRHPAVLAKEAATVDLLSGGRLELGIGAGWMQADYDQGGIPFDRAGVRIRRLEELAVILRGVWTSETFSFDGEFFTLKDLPCLPSPAQAPPPILIAGGGPKLLAVAGRQADIVAIAAPASSGGQAVNPVEFSSKAYEQKIGWVQEAAGDRFAAIELNSVLLGLVVLDDGACGTAEVMAAVERVGARLGGIEMTEAEVRDSPAFAIGSLGQVTEKLLEQRARLGLSYYSVGYVERPEMAEAVIAALSGA